MDGDDAGHTSLAQLRESAKGWHSAQLAVLAFIGLCGVLTRAGDAPLPRWLVVTAGLLVVLALVLAVTATTLVALVAWPLWGVDGPDPAGSDRLLRPSSHRLRMGIALTFLAVGVLAVAATSSWWPTADHTPAAVELTTGTGVFCGELGDGPQGQVALTVGGRALLVPLDDVVRLRPVSGCQDRP